MIDHDVQNPSCTHACQHVLVRFKTQRPKKRPPRGYGDLAPGTTTGSRVPSGQEFCQFANTHGHPAGPMWVRMWTCSARDIRLIAKVSPAMAEIPRLTDLRCIFFCNEAKNRNEINHAIIFNAITPQWQRGGTSVLQAHFHSQVLGVRSSI